jgi:hypothetical protein
VRIIWQGEEKETVRERRRQATQRSSAILTVRVLRWERLEMSTAVAITKEEGMVVEVEVVLKAAQGDD